MSLLKRWMREWKRGYVLYVLGEKDWVMVSDARGFMPRLEEADRKYRSLLESADDFLGDYEQGLAFDVLIKLTEMFEEDGMEFPVAFWKLMAEIAVNFQCPAEHYVAQAALMDRKVQDGKEL